MHAADGDLAGIVQHHAGRVEGDVPSPGTRARLPAAGEPVQNVQVRHSKDILAPYAKVIGNLLVSRKLELNTGRPEPGNNGYWQLGYQQPQACVVIG